MKYLSLFGLVSILIGQSAWNSGELSFDYQTFPSPAQTLSLSGGLLSNEVPHEGVGGFKVSTGDTNLVTLVAYDLYVSGSDTLADIFVIFMSDTTEIMEGNYTVNPSPDALKIFVWLSEVDPESLAGLLNASFTLDSLAAFNPLVSVSGQIEISSSTNFNFEMSFSGMMIGQSFELVTISNGHITLLNTLPAPAFSYGRLDYDEGENYGTILGPLNPIASSEGAGAFIRDDGEILTYHFIAYRENAENVFDIYGLIASGTAEHFPLDGNPSGFNISPTDTTYPKAVPYVIMDASLDEFLQIMESGEPPGMEAFSQLYLPVSAGIAEFHYNSMGNAEFDMWDTVNMANTAGDLTTLLTQWQVSTSPVVSIDNNKFEEPQGYLLVGYAFPNPFNSSTLIPVQLSGGQLVTARLYNLRGQQVSTLEFGYLGPGQHQLPIELKNSNLGGGLYYYSILDQSRLVGRGSFIYLK